MSSPHSSVDDDKYDDDKEEKVDDDVKLDPDDDGGAAGSGSSSPVRPAEQAAEAGRSTQAVSVRPAPRRPPARGFLLREPPTAHPLVGLASRLGETRDRGRLGSRDSRSLCVPVADAQFGRRLPQTTRTSRR